MDENRKLIQLSESGRFWSFDFDRLSLPEQVFRTVWELEAQVNNGGFDQYFRNSTGDTAFAAVAALESIGAANAARIVATANSLFPGSSPPRDGVERSDCLDALTEVQQSTLDDLDQQFFGYPDDLTALLHAFVARNAEQISGAQELGFES